MIRQIFEQFQHQILNGILPSGFKMPASRALAEELGISRNVVLEAYDQLFAEGYIETRTGIGTFVVEGVTFVDKVLPQIPQIQQIGFFDAKSKDIIDFRSGLPDLNFFPINLWLKLTREVYHRATPDQLSYGRPEGRMELRKTIAEYVISRRGAKCHPEQVLITAGTTQGIGLVSRLLLQSKNKNVVIEDPITADIQKIIEGFAGKLYPIPVDNDGLMTDKLPHDLTPRFIFITPSHQFPLGATMPVQRRVQLLEYAQKTDAFIVEDDYDSEFRYDAMPVTAIQGLGPERVVYMGTFSKTLCPSLRIGYLILPPALIETGRQLKWFTDLHNATMDQLVLSKFVSDGHYNRYVGKVKKIQKQRRLFLIRQLSKLYDKQVTVLGSATGLHLTARFEGVRFTDMLLEKILEAGVKVYPVEEHTIVKGKYEDSIILGYGTLDNNTIEKGLNIIKRIISQLP